MPLRRASCSCGQLTAETSAAPLRVSVCHCLECQRRTGSVFGAQARFPADSVTIRGEYSKFFRVGDEGTRICFNFCPTCGSTVYYTMDGHEDRVAIPIGAFADPLFPAPAFSVYESRKHSWVSMPDGVERLG